MTAAAPAQTQPPEAELQFDIGSTDDSLERMLELFARLGDIYRVFVPARGSYTYVIHHPEDRKSTRLNSSHLVISYAVFCLKKKKTSSSYVFSHNWTLT